MDQYLIRRGGTYYFRRAIPVDLRRAFGGMREITFSLRTKSREEAKRLRIAAAYNTDLLLLKARTLLSSDGSCDLPSVLRSDLDGANTFEKLNENLSLLQSPASLPKEPSRSSALFSGTLFSTSIVDAWAAERKPRDKTVSLHRSLAKDFTAKTGKDTVEEITKKDVLAFKKSLIENGDTPGNIKTKLSRLRTLLSYAEQNEYIEANPAAKVSIQCERKTYKTFKLEELDIIFSQPIFNDGHRPSGGKGEAAYWLPILAALTGARREELGQLRAKDVAELTVVNDFGETYKWWFIRIAEDTGDELVLKNRRSARLVPVSPMLFQLGFLDYLGFLKSRGEKWLFPLLPQAAGQRTEKWGQWFSRFLRVECEITDPLHVFHSFRHTFKDNARDSKIPEGVQRAIMGHAGKGVADEYGEGYSLHQLVQGIKLYRIAGLSIGGRKLEWASN